MHQMYKNNRISKDLVLELAKEPQAKSLFQDKYIEACNDLKAIEQAEKSALECATLHNEDEWVHDLIKNAYKRSQSLVQRTKSKFHRLLMINTGNYKEPASIFDLPRIKQVPIEDLIPLTNPRRSHNRIIANCPYHKEKTPSFVVYTESNTAYCFGCQFHGDNINCVMEYHNLSFIKACKLISS